MVSQFGTLGYTIMGKTADLTVVQKTMRVSHKKLVAPFSRPLNIVDAEKERERKRERCVHWERETSRSSDSPHL